MWYQHKHLGDDAQQDVIYILGIIAEETFCQNIAQNIVKP